MLRRLSSSLAVRSVRCARPALYVAPRRWATFFTKSHEWVRVDGGVATVGITQHAIHMLNDIVHADLPDVDLTVQAGAAVCAVESVKAAADVYSPISGVVTEVNTVLEENPALVSEDPEKDGWLFKLKPSSLDETKTLLNAEQYKEHCENEEH